MSQEHQSRPYRSDAELFGLTDKERLWDRVSETRLQEILNDSATTIHDVSVSSNTYGEFLFIVLSRTVEDRQIVLSLFGLGFHEYREQWITDHWRWYISNPSFAKDKHTTREEAMQKIEARRTEIADQITDETPSDAAMLFGLLADLGDEDGAYSFLEDMGWEVDWSAPPSAEDEAD